MARLVITQKIGDKIYISNDKEDIALITIGKVDRNQVRLVFEADRKVHITRGNAKEKEKDMKLTFLEAANGLRLSKHFTLKMNGNHTPM